MAASDYATQTDASVDAQSIVNELVTKDGFRDNDDALRSIANLGNSYFNQFAGDASDGIRTDTVNVTEDLDGKQFEDWTIPVGIRVTLGAKITRFAVRGTFTLTGILDASAIGHLGGASITIGGPGNPGTDERRVGIYGPSAGGGGGAPGGPNIGGSGGASLDNLGGAAGASGAGPGGTGTSSPTDAEQVSWWMDLTAIVPGPGGGSGASLGPTSGKGGNGGGAVWGEIEELIFAATGSFLADGEVGGTAVTSSGGGGGGGAGGTAVLACRSAPTNLGTASADGGLGGAGLFGGAGGFAGNGRIRIVVVPN